MLAAGATELGPSPCSSPLTACTWATSQHVSPLALPALYLIPSRRRALPWTKLKPVVPVTATFFQYLESEGGCTGA